MESALLKRIKDLGPHAQLREQHPENIMSLLKDIETLFRAVNGAAGTIELLRSENSALQSQINGLDKRKKNKWGCR